jgi:transposase
MPGPKPKRKRSQILNLGAWAGRKKRKNDKEAEENKENVCDAMVNILGLAHSSCFQEYMPSRGDQGSTKSRASSIISTIGSIFQRSRTKSPTKQVGHTPSLDPGSPAPGPSLWSFATKFFIEKNPADTDISTPSIQSSNLPYNNLDMDMTSQDQRVEQQQTVEAITIDNVEAVDPMAGDEDSDDDDDDLDAQSDQDGEGQAQDDERDKRWLPPTITVAKDAHSLIRNIIRPPRNTGKGYKDPKIDLLLRSRLEAMMRFLWAYTNPTSKVYNKWTAASLETAAAMERGPWFARRLREWSNGIIADSTSLPFNIYGTWNKSRLNDEDLQQEILTHLQGIGKYICAEDVSRYMERSEVKKKYGMKKGITVRTARNWLSKLGYRWTLEPSGQYVDGHEREDVVGYRQNVFLPRWKALEHSLRIWTLDGKEEETTGGGSAHPVNRKTVVWFHDESTFFANDRRRKRWCHVTETAVPKAKGEGASLMAAHFVSADYGWLQSPDGQETARVLFKAGKAREGYFTNENVLEQAQCAMEIATKYYPADNHVFVFDNATTHLKRPATAISARKMTKNPSKTFGCEVTVFENGRIRYKTDGKPEKKKLPMDSGTYADGSVHEFYQNGVFIGMAKILEQRGLTTAAKLKAECKNFKCPTNATTCCQRRVLYNQPDFAEQESALEILCHSQGFEVIFLPKFHCELNFIEQCWGHSKRVYRQYPPSSKEEDLQKNLLSALESVPLEVMRRYVNF